MQKELKSLLVAAGFVAGAAIIFIACGSGVTDIGQDTLIEDSVSQGLKNSIASGEIYNSVPSSDSEPSSSSKPDPESSSSQPPQQTQSSSSRTPSTQSSSSQRSSSSVQPSTSSSSSSRPPSSSSSKPPTPSVGGCKGRGTASNSCNWDKTTVIGGDVIKPVENANVTKWDWMETDGTTNDDFDWGVCNEVPAAGVTTGSGGTYYSLWATIDGNSVYCGSIKPKKAPTVVGTCSWDSNPTAAAAGATASGVTLTDTDGVCGTTKPPVKYYYENGDPWPQGGKVSVGMHKVYATVDCPNYPSIGKKDCPELEVKDVMYELKTKTDTVVFEGPINTAIKMSLPDDWDYNGSHDGKDVKFICQVARANNSDGSLKGTVDGTTIPAGKTDYIEIVIPYAHTIKGYSFVINITAIGGPKAVCKVGN